MAKTKPSRVIPVMAFFQEAVAGDILKFKAKSNIAQTGGGARDLRISPVADFWDSLLRFFPERISEREYRGQILTAGQTRTISLMGPTSSRRNECRICRIPLIDSWNISQQEFKETIAAKQKWIYMLILDDQGRVWASKFSTDRLNEMHKTLVNAVNPLLTDNQTVRGIVTF